MNLKLKVKEFHYVFTAGTPRSESEFSESPQVVEVLYILVNDVTSARDRAYSNKPALITIGAFNSLKCEVVLLLFLLSSCAFVSTITIDGSKKMYCIKICSLKLDCFFSSITFCFFASIGHVKCLKVVINKE